MMPLPSRWLTSMMARFNGHGLIIDCGEGTQIALKNAGWSAHDIDVMCFTHYHADHISGLPGMLLSMGNGDRTAPVLMIGPKGLERVVNNLRTIAPELPFPLLFHELSEDVETVEVNGMQVTGFKVHHKLLCYGYTIEVPRIGRFDAARAREQEIPMCYWNRLQHGETVEADGRVYTPDMVLGAARKGLKVTYCTDTRPLPIIEKQAAGADLFICEGMYGDTDCWDKAKGYTHMMMQEAAQICRAAQPKEAWLTHFSPSMMKPMQYLEGLQKIYPSIYIPKDGWMKELRFDDE